ncbi:hypothetical protein AB205_0218650 [Aquarana catesbeiana]|uniref:Uncharacterized protein n=1 Tax=Aquarana catesbeiana TaxID=8400 RepID=A0A2G9QAB6_AQUCT|nr:hypothetical protein AB205_0218650 [Aquarana catesbeiana]
MEENIAAFIAYKMQRMEEGQQVMCEALILEALEKGPTPPPATSPTAQPQPRRKHGRKTRQ